MTTYIQRKRRRKLKEHRKQMLKQKMLGILAITVGIAALVIFGALDVTIFMSFVGIPCLISKRYFLDM